MARTDPVGLLDRMHESLHSTHVLLAGIRPLNSAGCIDREWTDPADRFPDRLGVQATGQDQSMGKCGRDQRPVEPMAAAAVPGADAVQQAVLRQSECGRRGRHRARIARHPTGRGIGTDSVTEPRPCRSTDSMMPLSPLT